MMELAKISGQTLHSPQDSELIPPYVDKMLTSLTSPDDMNSPAFSSSHQVSPQGGESRNMADINSPSHTNSTDSASSHSGTPSPSCPETLGSLVSTMLVEDVPSYEPPSDNTEDNTSDKSYAAPLLPPCRVCGEKASGFHYGANTCEACKGFFRRCLQRKEEYKCIGDGNCDIIPGKRNSCAYCRYKKCMAVGMSRHAIKTGRYTHAKKTRDIEEVKRLEHQQKLSKKTGMKVSAPLDRDHELERIIRHITTVHQQQTPHTPEFFEQLPRKEKEFLEQRSLQQQMFGMMRPIPKDEYMQIYKSTGIDIDGRQEMIKHMIPCIEKAIKRFIAFAKALPGFKDLPIDDQIALIKGSRYEAWLISTHKAFNPEKGLFTHVCGYTVDINEMAKVHDMEFLELTFNLCRRMKRMKLSTEEECILKSLSILATDRSTLNEPYRIENIQNTMLEAMAFLMRMKHPNDKSRVGQLMSILTDLRTLTEMNILQEEKIETQWHDHIRFPPLLYEICSSY